MPTEITISLIKIMNWTDNQQDTKLEISFFSVHTKTEIAHKSVLGSYIDNTILLNTSFKLSYQENDNKFICKVAILKEYRKKEVVGEAVINLELFELKKIQYVTFTGKDKLMEIHRVEEDYDENRQNSEEESVVRNQRFQHNFLQLRYDFLDKIANKQIELKKDFSEKVYNLLKDIKYGRANQNLRKEMLDRKMVRQNIEVHKYQTPERQKQDKVDHLKKMELKLNQIEETITLKTQINKPEKQKKLIIDSIQANGQSDTKKETKKHQKEQYAEEEQEIVIPKNWPTKKIRSIYKY